MDSWYYYDLKPTIADYWRKWKRTYWDEVLIQEGGDCENEYTAEATISISVPADKGLDVYIQAVGQAADKIYMAKQKN